MDSGQISRAAILETQIKAVWEGGWGAAEQRNKGHLNRRGKRVGRELPARRGVIWRQLCAT